MLDRADAEILRLLQPDATVPVAEVAKRVGLSEQECQDRISKLEADGVIKARVTLLDPRKAGTGVTVFVAITLLEHSQEWLDRFHSAVQEFPEVVEFYRMSGAVDYLLRVAVADIDGYDAFYKKLIAITKVKDISSTFAMEQIKFTTVLPLHAGS
ncbi:MAG: ArsR family transcriptional regulator [Alphaproteobacteria bacterium BRH_c36]|nr:MAG: ArsR family transcriptional regulator [Alphaproteobacteria bacterium BRH_c36]